MRIPDEVQELLHRARERQFVTLTTIGRDNWPHARPMDLFTIEEDGEGILFASVNPGTTAENLRSSRRAEVLIAEREPKVGYSLEGWVEYIADARAPEVQTLQALDPARAVVGAFRFRVQRVRVATPLQEKTGELLPGSEPRRQPLFRSTDFDVPSDG